jgi:pimeloyl-ACP methyl ester carboxylesterase
VLEAEHAKKVTLFGNSLGRPVAIEAALPLPGRVLGVVGIDTFQSLTYSITPQEAQKMADAFRDDYAGSLRQMVRQLFHKDADPAMLADAEQRMAHPSPAAAHSMFLSLA